MEDKKPHTINVEMTPHDVSLFIMMLESTYSLMGLVGVSHESFHKFKDQITPLCNRICENAQKEIVKQEVDDLGLTFTDKNSPKDKTNE